MVISILLSQANAQEIYIDPYIQALEHNEVWIMWEDDQPETADVLWGVDSTLGNSLIVHGISFDNLLGTSQP